MSGTITDVVLAHGFGGGSGWLHPLTGWDHTTAMVAVGAWSAQLGKRSALWLVPAGFVAAMAVGSATGLAGIELPGTEVAIAMSVVLLGLAIAFRLRVTTAAAAAAVAVFGLCHGSAHGLEYASQEGKVGYVLGILVTTAGLHVAGAVGALLVTDWRHGGRALRIAGASATAIGLWLVTATLQA
ncbi:HupE/UreJ family protein [Streptomyces sp. NPDC127084]|uniref:HupE/UreJ family protein n=1 Tax=Streptomyces sp. NPDC127084 TaxID=3347133 RepID=UPI0036652C0F